MTTIALNFQKVFGERKKCVILVHPPPCGNFVIVSVLPAQSSIVIATTLMQTTAARNCRFHLMTISHKDKTLAALLAFLLGGLGAHRYYLYGKKDVWAWVHLALFPLSIFPGFIEALVIGLTSDDKWDRLHNANSLKRSRSGWPLALTLILTTGIGAIAIIAAIARVVDYAYTGGAYG